MRKIAQLLIALLATTTLPAFAADVAEQKTTTSHGFSILGDLKYDEGFSHFEYVNPDAPKGGHLKLHTIGTFDSLNPFILKGHVAASVTMLFDSLMAGSGDEVDSYYGLLAESVTMPEDRSWMEFTLRSNAYWHDGTPITIDDIIFSYNILKEKGLPSYRMLLKEIEPPVATAKNKVKFVLNNLKNRDLPAIVAGIPILSKAHYSKHAFDETTLVSPLGSGPYKILKVDPGKSITYERVKNYWANDLNLSKGHFNFDTIQIDYYRDREVALEAFKSGEYDIRQEFVSKSWATEYDFPAVKEKKVILEKIPDQKPVGIQATFINLRKDKFTDRRVRKALSLAFDFEWLNKNIFFSAYKRTNSVFEGSPIPTHEPPSEAELAILEQYRGKIPDEVFTKAFKMPVNDGTGRIRKNLRSASLLLKEAGWEIKDGKRVNDKGETLTVEFLLYEPSLKRIYQPFIKNLEKLGIDASIRMVDTTQYQNRFKTQDYDMISLRLPQSLAPGIEQKRYWDSSTADLEGSANACGIKNPVIDELIEQLINAKDYDEVLTYARVIDRILMWEYYFIPAWYHPAHNVAYWNKFSRPEINAPFANMVGSSGSSPIGTALMWWYDEEKAKALN